MRPTIGRVRRSRCHKWRSITIIIVVVVVIFTATGPCSYWKISKRGIGIDATSTSRDSGGGDKGYKQLV